MKSKVQFTRQDVIDLAIEMDYALMDTEDGNELDLILQGEFGDTLDDIRQMMSE